MRLTCETFLKDVETHILTLLLDQGVYRHIRFRKPSDSWNLWFEIVTWPGTLVIRGDMGTWAFARIEDMFGFFRSGLSGGELRINESYWAEKIESESRFGGPHEKFSPSTFKANVLSSLDGYGLDEDERKRVTEELEEVFSVEDESTAYGLLQEFKCGDFQFQDSWEITGMAYTYHFRWCLFAIVWAIRQYDLLQSANAGQLQPESKGEESAKPKEN
jgi:hypothetical protein